MTDFPYTHERARRVYVDFYYVINLTKYRINMYDRYGSVASFHPGCGRKYLAHLDPRAMVILESADEAPLRGVPARNAVVVNISGIGRHGREYPVSQLIRPEDGATAVFCPELTTGTPDAADIYFL